MPLRLITGEANAGKTGVILSEALDALAWGASPIIVVPTLLDARRMEAELSSKGAQGIRVATTSQLISDLWAIHGDGRRLIGRIARETIVGALVDRYFETQTEPPASTRGFKTALCGTARVSRAVSGQRLRSLGALELAMDELMTRYRETMERAGLVEPTWAAQYLAALGPEIDGPLGVMRHDTLDASQVEFFLGMSGCNDVSIAITWKPNFAPTQADDSLVAYLLQQSHEHVSVKDGPAGREIDALRESLFSGPRGLAWRGDVELALASGDEAEAVLAASAARAQMDCGVPAGRIAVAFPSFDHRADVLWPAFASVGVRVEPDVHMAFLSTGFGRAYSAVLALALGVATREQAMTLAASPFSGCAHSAVHDMDREWRRGRVDDSRALLDSIAHCGEAPRRIVVAARAVAAERGAPRNAGDWQELADALGAAWFGRAAVGERTAWTSEGAAHRAVGEAIAEMTAVTGEPPRAADILKALPSIYVRQATEENEDRVQVMEMSAVGARRFDVLILGGLTHAEMGQLDHGIVIDAASDHEFDDPTQESLARMRFYSLVSKARSHLVLIRREADSEGRELRASSLWEDVVDAYRAAGVSWEAQSEGTPPITRLTFADLETRAPAMTEGRPAARREAASLKAGRANRDVIGPSDEKMRAPSSAVPVSPTEIESYLACPYRWFVERVVNAEEIDVALDSRELGTRAHRLLAEFYQALMNAGEVPRVRRENLSESLELFEKLAGQARFRPMPASTLADELASARAIVWARATILADADLLPGFSPAHAELPYGDSPSFEFGGALIRGRIDRIDSNNDALVVTDYKSSRTVPGFAKFGEEGKVQAVIYALGAEHALGLPVVASVYRSMRSGRIRGLWRTDLLDDMPQGFCEKDRLGEEGFVGLVERTEYAVADAIEGMRSGRIPRQPRAKSACAYCPVRLVCDCAER